MADLKRSVIFDVDSQSAKKAVDSLKAINAEASREVDINNAIAQSSVQASRTMTNALANASDASRDAVQGQVAFADSVRDSERAVLDLDARLEGLDENFDRVSRNVGFAGDIQSNLGAIRGLTGTALGGQAGAVVGNVSEVIALVEELPRLKASASALVPALASASTELGLGGLSGGLQTLIPSLSSTSAGALVFGGAVAGIGLAFLAVNLVIQNVTQTIEDAKQAEEAYLSVLLETNQVRRDVQSQVESGDIQGLLAQRDQIQQTLTGQLQDISDIEAEINRLNEARQANLDAKFFGGSTLQNYLDPELQRIEGSLSATAEQLSALDQQAVESVAQLNIYEEALSNFTDAQIESAQNAEAIAVNQEDLTQAEQDRARVEQERLGVTTRLTSLEEQRNDLLLRNAETERRALEDRALERQFANEDDLAEERKYQASLAQIKADGKAKLFKIEESITALASERAMKEAELVAKSGTAQNELQADFFKTEQKALKDFTEKEQQIQAQGQKERLRLLQDLGDSLADAERDNNVIAFLQAQRDGEKRLARLNEDADAETKQRSEEYTKQREETRQALIERQADLAQSLNEERARLNASYAEKRQALQDSLKAERDAINARLEQAKAQYAEQERLEDEQASRQAQRDALRESRADADFNAQLARISGLQQAEQTRYDALNTDLMQLDSTIANLQGTISSLSDGVPNSVSAPMSKGNKGGFGSFSLVGLGSSTNRFLNSFGSASGGASGGFTYAPQINATVGDVASKSMVEQAFQSYAELDAQNWASTFGGLLTP